MTSKNNLNILVVQLLLLFFCSICFSITNKICFTFKWRSIIIISHFFIINYLIYLKSPQTSWSIRIIVTELNQIVHMHCNINKICFINKSTINFCRTIFKRCTVFKYYLRSSSKYLFSLRLGEAAGTAIVLVTVIFPLTKIYASE